MATRQYIGPRFVLKIYENSQNPGSADWEANTHYEPLVMVTYHNSSYISKKDVPATVGNPTENPAYWCLSGYYNGQIAELQNRMSDAESDISDLGDSVDALEDNVTNILNNTHGRVIMIGDSYANTSGFFTQVASMLGVTNRCNISFLGGTGFSVDASGYTGNNGFLRLLNGVIGNLTAEEKAEVTDVLVVGGYNDAASFPNSEHINAVTTGITNFKTAVDTNLPNAKISVAMIGYIAEGYGQGYTRVIDDLLFTEYIYMYTCNSLNINYMTSPKYSMCSTYYGSMDSYIDTDGIHPKSGAAHFIARAVVNALNGNDCETTMPTMYSPATITSADGSWSSNLNLDYEVVGQNLTVRWYAKSIGCDLTVENDRRVKVASFTMPRACWFNHTHIAYMNELAVTGGVRKQCSIQFEFHEDQCDVYMITPLTGNLTLFNIPYGEITVNMFAK